MIENLEKTKRLEKNSKILEALFAEYTLPDPFTFDVVDNLIKNCVFDDKEKIQKKYSSAIGKFGNKDYVSKVAARDCHVLAIASDEIRNDAEFFLKLCEKKIVCAQYIGNELRQNKQFLLALDNIDNRCWRYIQKIHCLRKSSLEEKIATWCLFWLGGAVRKSELFPNGFSMQSNITDKNGKKKYTTWLGMFAALAEITPCSPKEEIIKFISEYECYTVDPSYAPIEEADPDIAKRMIACDTELILHLQNKKELLNDYGVVIEFWKRNSDFNVDTARSIRNFADDRELAKLILEDRELGSLALEFFSENIRGDKDYILKLFFEPRISGIGRKLFPTDLAFVTDKLKADEDFLKRIGKENVRTMNRAEKKIKNKWYLSWRKNI